MPCRLTAYDVPTGFMTALQRNWGTFWSMSDLMATVAHRTASRSVAGMSVHTFNSKELSVHDPVSQTSSRGVVVITGAAGGMGSAVARLFAAQHRSLLLIDRPGDRLDTLARELGALTEVHAFAVDIADPYFLGGLSKALGGRLLDTLIHCAAVSGCMADGEAVLDVNLGVSIELLDWVQPRLAEGGAVVLVSSSGGTVLGNVLDDRIETVASRADVSRLLDLTDDPQVAYSISKRGVQLLAKNRAMAFGERGTRIVSVSPGIVETPMALLEMSKTPMMATMIENAPIRRPGRPEEVAHAIKFLASSKASFITGVDLLVDGGQTERFLASMKAMEPTT